MKDYVTSLLPTFIMPTPWYTHPSNSGTQPHLGTSWHKAPLLLTWGRHDQVRLLSLCCPSLSLCLDTRHAIDCRENQQP